MIRTFIAARIAENSLLRLLHQQLAELGDPFRPVPLADLHVTLKFLGNTDERQVPKITAVMQNVAARHAAEIVSLVGLGAFPQPRRPSVIWIGMENAVSLTAIAGALESELLELGFPAERRPFQSHLTVLRVKTRPPESLFTLLSKSSAADFGTTPISSIELLQSDLLDGGPRYSVLASAPLSPSARGA
jgi:2'-5' RNA ligase